MSGKIYTKTGDNGLTSLIGGTKVSKNDIRINAYGSIDELNSFIGLSADLIDDTDSRKILKEIQDRLFTIGSSLACDPLKKIAMQIPDLHESDIHLLEKQIDSMQSGLPELKSFILPGGHKTVSTIHVARTVCRRAERATVQLNETEALPQPLILIYLNRLSDYLFVLARFQSLLLGVEEVHWHPRKKS